jgi:hypothetical protein
MAQLFATETALKATGVRVHGGYGYPRFPVERLYRDAPLLVINERLTSCSVIIARQSWHRIGVMLPLAGAHPGGGQYGAGPFSSYSSPTWAPR